MCTANVNITTVHILDNFPEGNVPNPLAIACMLLICTGYAKHNFSEQCYVAKTVSTTHAQWLTKALI